ncbi:MAG: galactose-1-phosphate uridylyltransferase [Gaiellales bacterium]
MPVVIAPGRRARPGALGRVTRVDAAATCPFCEGHEQLTPPETLALDRPPGAPADSPGWSVRVVPNKYPAIPGQEVAVHGGVHVTSVAEVEPAVLERTLDAWAARRAEHRRAGASWVLACINEGPGAGASLEHSHSQLVPFAELPPTLEAEQRATSGDCRLCGVLDGEARRTVVESDGLLAFCPGWSRLPYEMWIAPTDHAGSVASHAALAHTLRDAVIRLRTALGEDLAWNAVLHDAADGGEFHWHVELLPRLTVPASLELGTGLWLNVVDPDVAAEELRAV